MLNTSKHIIASNKADSSLSRFSLALITILFFLLPASFMLHLSAAILSPLHQLLLWGFISLLQDSIFSPVPALLLPFLPLCMWGTTPHARTFNTHGGKWLKAQMCTVHELILWVNQHVHAVFFFSIEAMDRLKALNENPLNRTFFTSTCITAGVTGVVTLSQKHDFTPRHFFLR